MSHHDRRAVGDLGWTKANRASRPKGVVPVQENWIIVEEQPRVVAWRLRTREPWALIPRIGREEVLGNSGSICDQTAPEWNPIQQELRRKVALSGTVGSSDPLRGP